MNAHDRTIGRVMQLEQVPIQSSHLGVVLNGARVGRDPVEIVPHIGVSRSGIGRFEITRLVQPGESHRPQELAADLGGATRLSFAQPGRYAATVVVRADGLVDRVESTVPDPE